jgi:hypothetical protein
MPILWGFLIIYIVTMVTIIITTHIENKGEKKNVTHMKTCLLCHKKSLMKL